MKKTILFALILSAATANGQKLKDLLYSGKLKMDSTGVVRSTDDLKSKTDTSQRKTEPQKPKTTPTIPSDSTVIYVNTTSIPAVDPISIDNSTTPALAKTPSTAAAKSNNKIWKEYTDSLTVNLKNDLFSSKKVKKETYYFTVEYEIGANGATTINNVTVTPENDFLVANVKQWMETTPPQLSAVLNSANQPQKVKRRHNFSVTKE